MGLSDPSRSPFPAAAVSQTTRRSFLAASAAAGGGVILAGTRASGAVRGANDRVRIAVAGLNGRGKNHLDGWRKQENVQIAYVIDPDANVLARTLKKLENEPAAKGVRGVADVREALEDPSLDALSIATPNHWHSLMTIWACQAGKHVYVEKPMSHDVAEGRVAVAAQKKYGVVVQHGTQRRSSAGIAGLHEALHAGKLPRLKIAYGYCCKPRGGIGFAGPEPPPKNLDWNLWKGPAALTAYHDNLVHYDWHWFWRTGNGDLNNQGTHQLDVARWAIDPDQTHPTRVRAVGGRFAWDDQGETPNTMFAVAEYPNGQAVMFDVRNVRHPGYKRQVYNEYYLEDGSVITGEGNYKILRPGAKAAEPLDLPKGDVTPGGNWGSFIAAVRAGDPAMANGNVTDAHHGCVLGHLMNNSYRLGEPAPVEAVAFDRPDAAEHFERLHALMRDGAGLSDRDTRYTVGPELRFDPAAERFVGEHAERANALLQDPQRPGFEIPAANAV